MANDSLERESINSKRARKTHETLSIREIKQLLRYDRQTGKLYWKTDRRGKAKAGDEYGSVNSKGYRAGSILGVNALAHRLAFAIYYNKWPSGEIDHINGLRDDNRISNLRSVDGRDNQCNRKLGKNNTIGLLGVYKAKPGWQATISFYGKLIYLGGFSDFFEACCARKSAELKYGYHPNHGH